jgi:antitoxin component YwqK of YwqJK toxin-antitoxin module
MAETPVQIDKYSGTTLLEQASYFKGRRHGTTVYYRSDGRIERIATFWYDQLNGPYYEFWPNGRLALEATYVYSALDTQIEYNELGQRIGPILHSTLHARPGNKIEPSILRVTQYRPE